LEKNRHETFPMSSHVAALGDTQLQFAPQANHVLWWLIVRREVTIVATRLVEPDIMPVLHWPAHVVELLNPHAHAYIFHLKKLHRNGITI
jgi:hypothetical protein